MFHHLKVSKSYISIFLPLEDTKDAAKNFDANQGAPFVLFACFEAQNMGYNFNNKK
jgi:hypothetical protein